ncbi:copper homeostasis protein CutC [Fodinibius sediminis]|uniref:PF03932 family protein CutC n=1 Tax=Fodinibius sediminis TaxID=1214077 RepID=A0A521EDF0_9BACT|nr:copper homeostasis protein CutC [Fodinibius sediminis]SMO81852.1 copper homeostasis protein [Fodinibius sediminis]
MTTEVVVYNIESALNAQEGGADRVELCDNPGGGGTTPSSGTIAVLSKELKISLFVMIRPREGDFCYSDLEFEAMKHDIRHARELGADGVVFGILSPDGSIDIERNRELAALARPLEVTCHRAFDMTKDPMAALESCIEVGFDRILTSGQQARAQQGIPLISRLVDEAGGRVSIMAGCGVNEETVEQIMEKTGVDEVHLSAESTRESKMKFRNHAIAGMGATTGKEYLLDIANAARVKEIRSRALSVFKG